MKVIAAITDDSAAPAVLASATAIAGLFSANVEALHAGGQDAAVAQAARTAGLTLRVLAGAAVGAIADAAAAEDVVAVVIGARGAAAGRRPAGSTATALVTLLEKPVVVVPPDAALERRVESVLVPLDGTAPSAEALQETLELASSAELRIVVAHVYPERSLPAFSDHLPHEVRAWREEFIARHCPAAFGATLELRVGEPHERLLDILRRSRCDLVALAWSQDLTGEHAAVVRRMLAHSPVPVLLTPADRHPARALAGSAPGAQDGDRNGP